MSARASASRGLRALTMGVLLLPMLSACADKDVPVSIHGVNYSGEVFSYVIVDPKNEANRGGGELIDPYAAGGTLCCYDLPRRWRSGIQVRVDATHWLPRKADGSLPEVQQTQLLEVPAYADGKPGELWVLRDADGKLSIVTSDYQPDHASWPGKIKGWPVPSLEYRREKWDVHIAQASSDLASAERYLKELTTTPEESIAGTWDALKERFPADIRGFTGAADPAFVIKVRADRENGVREKRLKLQELQKERL